MKEYSLLNNLINIAKKQSMRLHMPGHKGKPQNTLLDGAFLIDFTEIPPTGNLFSQDEDIISQAEDRCAEYFNCDACLFLTCGATQGIKAAIATYCKEEYSLLVDRNTHKSVIDACMLLDIYPQYIEPDFDKKLAITKGFDLVALENTLKNKPSISAFMLTSPTYYGYCHDVEKIVEVCQKYNVKVLVDCAHGSHLEACHIKSPISQGADAVICSAHKTFTSLTQGALLLLNSNDFKSLARKNCALFGTTSPSYPIMSSLEMGVVNAFNLTENELAVAISSCNDFRKKIQTLGFLSPFLGDPLRITINCNNFELDGYKLYDWFRENNMEPEMCDSKNVVLIMTFADDFSVLEDIYYKLSSFSKTLNKLTKKDSLPLPPLPQSAFSPRKCYFSPKFSLLLKDSCGKIAGENIFIYPPGVPIITVGEIINKKSLEYLADISYNMYKEIDVISL